MRELCGLEYKLCYSLAMEFLDADSLIDLYLEGRQTLYKDTRELTVSQLDWPGIDPSNCVTAGSMLLHIAGFDNLVRSALEGCDLTSMIAGEDWKLRFEAGFPRELGIEPPKGNPIDYYLNLLDEETKATQEVLLNFGDILRLRTEWTDFYIDGRELQPDGFEPYRTRQLPLHVLMHDRYHRGQITQNKYVMRCLTNATRSS